jgi:tetratricopeptide (TPR) repeat protein
MRLPALLLLAALAAPAAAAAPPQGEARPDYVADQECVACHPRQAALWAGSKHDRAMQPATPATVLGAFGEAGGGGVAFSQADQHAGFLRRGERFVVRTTGPDGKESDFPVTHTFGVYPLQQYLLPLPGGRLQAFSLAWDTRRQRWFSLYPEGGIAPGSSLHWSGRYQNWNLMCGECHTTAYRKRYDEDEDSYRTTWAAPDVGCQACHGAGREHAVSARRLAGGRTAATPAAPAASPGATTDLVPTPNRALYGHAHDQVDQCAACHARRTRLQEDTPAGAPFLDHYLPDNLRADLYHVDGQQLEEVFEYGSYRQSRMYQAGVACTDCHDAHSGRRHAEGNALCLRCHGPAPDPRFAGLRAKDYDSPAHHFHAAGQPGSQCVDCHMPSRDYMIVHGRRDHAIRIPRPDLTRRLGTPNACQACHGERSPEWAVAAIERHFGPRAYPEHYGEVFAAARAGATGAEAKLQALITRPGEPAIVRASAIELLAGLDSAAVPPAALTDADPVVRAAAAAALAARPAAERLARLPALLDDPRRAVRITAARGLADLADADLPVERRPLRRHGLTEFVAAQRAMGDMPSAQLNLATLFLSQRDAAGAERHYRLAIAQDPVPNAGRLGLAELLAGSGREDEAAQLLRAGLAKSANPGELHFALGLLAGQRQRWQEAARELQAAAALLPGNPRVRRNLDIVLRRLQQGTPR